MPVSVDRRDVLLYLNSYRILRTLPPDAHDAAIRGMQQSGTYKFSPFLSWAGTGPISARPMLDPGRYGNKPVSGTELTADEEAAVQLVWKLVGEKGKSVHIVDVGKESALRRFIQEHLHHLRRFPVLVRPDGRRLEGIEEFTPEKLENFLSD